MTHRKHTLSILVICFCSFFSVNSLYAQTHLRYFDPIFAGVTTTTDDVVFASNYTIEYPPDTQIVDISMDIYQPGNTSSPDTISSRPLIIYLHTGSFLPLGVNGSCTGDRKDNATVEMATQFASRGYVVAVVGYRRGWNPFEMDDTKRLKGLLVAAYRGIQDARTAVRFFKHDYTTSGNTYGVDTSRISIVGQGTGGYLSLGCATLDKFSEINLFKFLDLSTGQSIADTSLLGDFYGFGGQWNVSNYPNYSSNFHLAINMGGCLADSSWLEGNEVPIIAIHSPNDPFGPYNHGTVIVPTTNENVIDVSGSQYAIKKANDLGVNDILLNRDWAGLHSSIFGIVSDKSNGDGLNIENLFPLVRPTPESSPWEWWSPTCPNHSSGIATNPDMSEAKARAYIDTIQNYLAPRMACVLDLSGGCPPPVGIGEIDNSIKFSIYPNPSNSTIMLECKEKTFNNIRLLDYTGKLIWEETNINSGNHLIKRKGLPSGLYYLQVYFESGSTISKLIFN